MPSSQADREELYLKSLAECPAHTERVNLLGSRYDFAPQQVIFFRHSIPHKPPFVSLERAAL